MDRKRRHLSFSGRHHPSSVIIRDEEEEASLVSQKKMNPITMVGVVFFLVCGGAYGAEPVGGAIPPLYAIIGLLVVPWVWSFPIAMITAELATAMPSEAGCLEWLRNGFGAAFVWTDNIVMISILIGDLALYPIIFSAYLDQAVDISDPFIKWGVEFCMILLALCINLSGPSWFGRFTQVCVLSAMAPFLLLFGAQFFAEDFNPKRWGETTMGNHGEADYTLWASVLVWATCGYEYSGFLAEQVENPRRTFPIVLLSGIALMTLAYLLPVMAALATSPDGFVFGEGTYPVVALNMGLGQWVVWFIILGGLASCIGTYNAYLNTAASALHSQAREGKVPKIFEKDLPFFGTPWVALLFYSTTTSIIILLDFSLVVEIESVLYCLHVILLCANFLFLRWKKADMKRPFAIPGGWVSAFILAILPIATSCFVISLSVWYIWIIAAGVVALSFIVFIVKSWFCPFQGRGLAYAMLSND